MLNRRRASVHKLERGSHLLSKIGKAEAVRATRRLADWLIRHCGGMWRHTMVAARRASVAAVGTVQ